MAASQQHSNTIITMCMCWRAVMRRSTLACAAAERTVATQWNVMANNRSGSVSRTDVICEAFELCIYVHRYAHSVCAYVHSVLRASLWRLGTCSCRLYLASRLRTRSCCLCAVRDMAASQQHSNTIITMCMCWRAVLCRSTLACAAAERTVATQLQVMANNRSGSGSRTAVIRETLAHYMHVHRYAHKVCECADSVLRASL